MIVRPSIRRLILSTMLSVLVLSPMTGMASFAQDAGNASPVVAAVKLPDIKTSEGVSSFTLDNGLNVVVIPDHRAPVVTQMIWYHVGSADEPAGKSGIAHFLEHLLFKGTPKHPAGEFSARVAGIGGQENAFTSYDYTAYFQRVAPEALPMVMEFESDRMTNIVITDDMVKTEREVIIEERRMRTDSNPGSILAENTNPVLYFNHPYRIPVIGWRQEMEGLGLQDAIGFYEKYYTPNNATLIIAGDISPEQVREMTLKTWALVPKRAEVGPRNRPQEPAKSAARIVTLHDERVSTPSFQRTWLVPSYANEKKYPAAKPGDAPALDLLGEILGGSMRSRLYQQLIVKQGIAGSSGAGYSGDALDDGSFTVYGSPRGDVSLGEVEKSVEAELARIIKDGVTETELNQARNRFLKAVIFARDSQSGMARIYGSSLATGGSIEEIQKWPDLIKTVTVEQIRDVAARYLRDDQAVTSYLLPPNSEPASAKVSADAAAGDDNAAPAAGAVQ